MKEKKEITAEQMRPNKYVFLLSLPIFVRTAFAATCRKY